MAFGLLIGLLTTQGTIGTILLGICITYFVLAFTLSTFAGWHEAQNYTAISTIPHIKSDDEELERRIACGIRYGRDYTQQ